MMAAGSAAAACALPLILFISALPANAAAGKKTFRLTVENKRIEIGLGLSYDAWTYDGAVPGPLLRVRAGDEVTITLVNPTAMAHGIDTHAAEVAPKLHFAAPSGRRDLSYSFRAGVPGAFLYQCSAIPSLSHVANGMYGMMIVDPAQGWPKAHEVMIVQGEYYGTPDKSGTGGRRQPQGGRGAARFRGLQRDDRPLRRTSDSRSGRASWCGSSSSTPAPT